MVQSLHTMSPRSFRFLMRCARFLLLGIIGLNLCADTTASDSLKPKLIVEEAAEKAFRLEFNAEAGQTYSIQGSSDLRVDSWQELEQLIAVDSLIEWPFTLTTESAFFIIKWIDTLPSISSIADQSIFENESTAALSFIITDSGTFIDQLIVTASSSDQTLVPDASLLLAGAGNNRTITATPLANQWGSTTITITVDDGQNQSTSSFLLTVNPTDSDGDLLPDYWEIQYGFDALVANTTLNSDDDLLSDLEEYQAGTDPTDPNTDDDGWDDAIEVGAGSDPLDPDSIPVWIDPHLDQAVLLWDFDTPAATDPAIPDSSLTANNGIAQLGTDAQPTHVRANTQARASYHFDGSGDYLQSERALDLTDNTMTVSLWVNIDGSLSSLRTPISQGVEGDDGGFSLSITGSYVEVIYWSGSNGYRRVRSEGVTFSAEQWYHLAFTRTADATQFYVDGQQVVSNIIGEYLYTENSSPATVPLTVGRYPHPTNFQQPFNGSVARPAVYQGLLSAEAIEGQYLQSHPHYEDQDSDADQLSDGYELEHGLNPYSALSADGDSLPDDWEIHHFGTTARDGNSSGDFDQDLLIDSDEFQYQTDPANPDVDADNMLDGEEVLNGLDPFTDDSYDDPDQDRYPNIYEIKRQSDPQSSSSIPAPDYIVGPAETFTEIQAAIVDALSLETIDREYDILLVKDGTYNYLRMPTYVEGHSIWPSKKLLILSENGPQSTFIENQSPSNESIDINQECVVDGLTIQNQAFVNTNTSVIRIAGNVRLYNCIVRNNTSEFGKIIDVNSGDHRLRNCIIYNNTGFSSGGVYLGSNAHLRIEHCTFYNNIGGAGGIYVHDESGSVRISNSIFWSPGYAEITYNSGAPDQFIHVEHSIVEDVENGVVLEPSVISIDPLLDAQGGLTETSPAINAGVPSAVKRDIGFIARPRGSAPDLGAEEFLAFEDADNDFLNDNWEVLYGLSITDATGDNGADGDPDGDDYTNLEEFKYNKNPMDANSRPVPASYRYDAIDRLIESNWPNTRSIEYDYDAAGNIENVTNSL